VSATTPARAAAFDLERPWRVHPQVALRPEAFGALAYHFGTRRLSFLKDRTLLAIVQDLARQPSAAAACRAAGVADADLPRYERALAKLADTDMICPEAA
jgi:putative mycofactocin binding protein MftB